MEKLGFDLDDGSSTTDQKQTNPSESRRLSIQRCIQSLLHACQCHGANCHLPSCQKMKRVVQHAKSCKRKTNGGCPICKQLIALCCYHAKQCQEANCPMPSCLNIKLKLRQRQFQQKLQQAQILKRKIPLMHSSQPGIGMKPTSAGPPAGNKCTMLYLTSLLHHMIMHILFSPENIQGRAMFGQVLERSSGPTTPKQTSSQEQVPPINPSQPPKQPQQDTSWMERSAVITSLQLGTNSLKGFSCSF